MHENRLAAGRGSGTALPCPPPAGGERLAAPPPQIFRSRPCLWAEVSFASVEKNPGYGPDCSVFCMTCQIRVAVHHVHRSRMELFAIITSGMAARRTSNVTTVSTESATTVCSVDSAHGNMPPETRLDVWQVSTA